MEINTDPVFIDPPGAYYGCILKPEDERNAIHAEQRRTLGFDDTETWDLLYTIARFILPRLKRFKEIGDFYVGADTAASVKPLGYEPTKEVITILDKMILAFEIIATGYDYEPKNKIKIQEGLDLFAKHFLALWW